MKRIHYRIDQAEKTSALAYFAVASAYKKGLASLPTHMSEICDCVI